MTRNKGRLAAAQSSASSTPAPLDFAVPTEIVDLPSKGGFYPKDHPLFGKKTVEIRFMTAKDEDILTSPSLLQRGLALDRLISSVLLDKNIDPMSLLACDRNAILIAIRVTGFGQDYMTEYSCPKCDHVNEETFNVLDYKVTLPDEKELEKLGATKDGDLYKFDVDGLGAQIAVRSLSYEEEVKISQASDRKVELGLDETITTDTLKAIIASVNGVDDPRIINHVSEQMPVSDSRRIRKIHSLISPAINLVSEVTCGKCTKTSELEVPFTTGFFWPKL
jgi:hypothetical protein